MELGFTFGAIFIVCHQTQLHFPDTLKNRRVLVEELTENEFGVVGFVQVEVGLFDPVA